MRGAVALGREEGALARVVGELEVEQQRQSKHLQKMHEGEVREAEERVGKGLALQEPEELVAAEHFFRELLACRLAREDGGDDGGQVRGEQAADGLGRGEALHPCVSRLLLQAH